MEMMCLIKSEVIFSCLLLAEKWCFTSKLAQFIAPAAGKKQQILWSIFFKLDLKYH